MKASELIIDLKALIKVYGDLDIIYATDDEGNGYDKVHYTPSVYIFIAKDHIISKEDTIKKGEQFIPNAICIN